MTNQIKRGELFLGLPMTRLKSLLKLFRKGTRHPAAVGRNSAVRVSRSLAAAMMGESLVRGLISFKTPEGVDMRGYRRAALTPAGDAITFASAMNRSSKTSAGKILDEILARAHTLSKDPKAPLEVKRIWVFGSFVDPEKEDVGDLDIVIEDGKKPRYADLSYGELVTHIGRYYPGFVPESVDYFSIDDHFLRRKVLGARKHPLVSTCGIHTLIDLHCKCRLVYDSERGGILPPQDFDHHPSSTERGSHIKERLAMPDLSGPVDTFALTPAEVVSAAFLGWRREERVLVDDEDIPESLREYVGQMEFNGDSRFGILVRSYNGHPVLTKVSRVVKLEGSNWQYDFEMEVVPLPGTPEFIHQEALDELSDIVGDLFNADIIRLADYRDRLSVYPDITASVTVTGQSKAFVAAALKQRVFELGRYTEEVTHSPRHEFGLEIELNGNGDSGWAPICSYDDNDWAEMADALPFTNEMYRDWLRRADPVRYEEMLFFEDGATPVPLPSQ